ncbi:MAG TPA: peptidoglycan DD-metalloendopeptidase family protein, partial [Coleofasciculaceae cyanobacterium]
ASVSPAPAAEPTVVVSAKPSVPVQAEAGEKPTRTSQSVVKHQVQKGDTLWELSKAYKVQPEAIAASNRIKPSGILPVGQTLKIPAVNGIVHEVKPGDTVKTLSDSYGVEPTQLQTPASVSEASQLQTGESVTVPGNVNDLLKARQDVALKRLKEHGNRLNESLAELRSEESTNLSKLATVPTEEASAESQNSVTLPPAVLKAQEPFPTPQIMATALPTPVVIPVPTPEMAASPTISPQAARQQESAVVIPVPTPELAASPTISPQVARQQESAVVIPVPTPELAASPTINPSPQAANVPNLATAPIQTPPTAAIPQVPQPVVIEPIGKASTANVYRVKPGDTVDAIARHYGVSRSELARANGLRNPNLLRINQQLKLPQAPTANVAPTVALLPVLNSNSERSVVAQEQPEVKVPALAASTLPEQTTPKVPTEESLQSRSIRRTERSESTDVEAEKPNATPLLAENKPSQSDDSQQSLYVEKLKADILRLREEYQNQKDSSQVVSASRTVAVPTVGTPTASTLSNVSASSRINPEFNPKRANESLQAGRGRLQQEPIQQGSIPIEVPPPETSSVATAPVPAGEYNRSIRTPVGATVSPDLPSLSAPDMYSPDSPTQFEGYIWPTKGVLTSGYGRRWGRMHKGIDIANAVGTPIVAVAPGVVVSAGWNSGGYGNLVEVQHPDGSITLYAHNNRILVRRGQAVEQGQQISEMGSTGYSTGPHLHFEVHPSGRGAVNPIAYLPKRTARR